MMVAMLRLAVLTLALGLSLPSPALAQAPPGELLRTVAGPYEIVVVADPAQPWEGLGAPRFSVRVTSAQDHAPVTDADVVIAMTRPNGTEAGQVKLTQNPGALNLYEGRLTLLDVGVWRWTVAVTSPRGLESVQGNIQVVEGPSSGNPGLYLWLALLAVLTVGGFLAYRALKPNRAREPRGTP